MANAMDYRIERYCDIEVCWFPGLDGGGRSFGQDFLPVVRNLFGHVGRVFEFCAGPGFVGFSLLAHGLCDSLTVADINPRAVGALRQTVSRNGLEDRVHVFHSDGLAGIPAGERWDLVVGNPPHFAKPFFQSRESLITDDPGY
jgi:methylase of polypeptide subunit release factors